MFTNLFYTIIDTELDRIISQYKDDVSFLKHKGAVENQKSYAFLIWFLEFYGRTSNYVDYITDGRNDGSCDIVFDNLNDYGEKIFYIVQSKWNNKINAEKDTSKDEILKALQDFETILHGEKQNVHPKLKAKLDELESHLKSNGEVKFIFLTLSQYQGAADDNIRAFSKLDVKTTFEVIDINRIKSDYIDRKYKKIEPINPLLSYQNPEEAIVTIHIEQKAGTIKIDKPYEAYVLLLRPKTIWELFKTYNFSLFFKNVRNPLLQSQFNTEIENTALDESNLFWYYNNGITAITSLLPEIGKKAEQIKVTGLQIINGAQTVYSIYRAYESASPTKRLKMDSEALITLRLLKSGGSTFDLNVTRFTNSQNPILDRDFCANDDIQIKLQNESYQTNIWFEKRRDEFRETPEGVEKIPNYIFANVYLAYHLQDPVSVLNNNYQRLQTQKDLNFISQKNHKNGLYEKIFNHLTTYDDMLCSYYLFDTARKLAQISYEDSLTSNIFHLIALFKTAFAKYLKTKFNDNIQVNKYIIELYKKDDKIMIIKTFKFLSQFINKQIEVSHNPEEFLNHFLYSSSSFKKILDKLEDEIIDIEGVTLD